MVKTGKPINICINEHLADYRHNKREKSAVFEYRSHSLNFESIMVKMNKYGERIGHKAVKIKKFNKENEFHLSTARYLWMIDWEQIKT